MPTTNWPLRTARWFVVAMLAFVSLLGTGHAQDVPTPEGATTGTWPVYGAALAATRAASDRSITAENVNRLQPLWQVEVGGPISATPVIVDGIAYVGSYDGTLYALELATGQTSWTYNSRAAVLEPNL